MRQTPKIKEFDYYIEGYNVQGICVGCLNYNREMFYRNEVKDYFKLLAEINVPDDLSIQVCWECLAAVQAIQKFKEKIQKSYDILTEYSKENPILNSPTDLSQYATNTFITSDVDIISYSADIEKEDLQESENNVKEQHRMVSEDDSFVKDKDTKQMAEDTHSPEDLNLLSDLDEDEEKPFTTIRDYRRNPIKRRRIVDPEALEKAMISVKNNVMGYRQAAKTFSVPLSALKHYVSKRSPLPIVYDSTSQEYNHLSSKIAAYTSYMENRYFGVNLLDIKKATCHVAVKHVLVRMNEVTVRDWLHYFLKQYRNGLPLRRPMTVAMRAQGFNREMFSEFYDNLRSEMEKVHYPPNRIFNVDAIGLTIVQDKELHVVVKKGKKEIDALTIAERESMCTFVCCMSASGEYIPPMFIFRRKKFTNELMKGAPPGSIGKVRPSGWIQTNLFIEWFKDFIDRTKPSAESPILLIFDGFYSHTRHIEFLELAWENHVTLVCILPESGHVLQPLDKGFLGALKSHYTDEVRMFQSRSKRRPNHFDIAELFGRAYLKSGTVENAVNGFRVTGIYPFDPKIVDMELKSTFLQSSAPDAVLQEIKTESRNGFTLLKDSQQIGRNIRYINQPDESLSADSDTSMSDDDTSPAVQCRFIGLEKEQDRFIISTDIVPTLYDINPSQRNNNATTHQLNDYANCDEKSSNPDDAHLDIQSPDINIEAEEKNILILPKEIQPVPCDTMTSTDTKLVVYKHQLIETLCTNSSETSDDDKDHTLQSSPEIKTEPQDTQNISIHSDTIQPIYIMVYNQPIDPFYANIGQTSSMPDTGLATQCTVVAEAQAGSIFSEYKTYSSDPQIYAISDEEDTKFDIKCVKTEPQELSHLPEDMQLQLLKTRIALEREAKCKKEPDVCINSGKTKKKYNNGKLDPGQRSSEIRPSHRRNMKTYRGKKL